LRLTSHKTSTPLDLIFSDVWGHALMFSFDVITALNVAIVILLK
jgi:hypothetical protein